MRRSTRSSKRPRPAGGRQAGSSLATALPLALLAALAWPAAASATVVDFDSVVAAPGGTLFGGGTFASDGVTFDSGTIPDAVAVGDVITFASPDPFLLVLGNSDAISAPNFAAASDVFVVLNDVLMSFSTPVTSVSLTTDDAGGEIADVVRLLALTPTGAPFEFMVVGIATGLDNATSSPANLLSVSFGGAPFSYALFQVTTEAEGFDDLTFTPVPEPGGVALLGLGLAGLLSAMRQRR